MHRSFVLLAFLSLAVSESVSQTGSDQVLLRIYKEEFRLEVFSADSLVKTYAVALGEISGNKQRRGDRRTPEGSFQIVQIQRSGYWTHDFGDGKGPVEGAYGPWFLRLGSGKTRMNWTGIGIHGTHDPSSIGKMVTEGCVRLENEELEELRKLVKIGTPVEIVP